MHIQLSFQCIASSSELQESSIQNVVIFHCQQQLTFAQHDEGVRLRHHCMILAGQQRQAESLTTDVIRGYYHAYGIHTGG